MNNVTRDGRLDYTKVRRVPHDKARLDTFRLRTGDVLFNATNSPDLVGKTALFVEREEPTVFSNHFLRIRANEELDPSYLTRWLQREFERRTFQGMCRQWVNQATVGRDALLSLNIPLPTLAEQRRIAAILDHADALRIKRREALGLLEELTQVIFLEMFGDPVHNDRSWTPAAVADLVAGFSSGRNLVGHDGSDGSLRVLKVSAVTSLTYRENESKPLPSGYLPPSEHMVRPGDLLFSRANTSELVGATAFVHATDGRTALPDKLWRFCWHSDRQVAPRYVEKLFQQPAFRRKISERATGSSGSMKNISREKVLSIPVGIPPGALQFEFQRRLEQIHTVEVMHRNALAQLDGLFGSLQSRAFRGEL